MPLVKRLAQKGRAAGIYLVLATQYPTVENIPADVKVNFNSRLAFRLMSGIQSTVIIDESGAEDLQGRGDCLLRTAEHQALQRCLVPEFDREFKQWLSRAALKVA
jgi:DNA segregation ATPase FtsK/SpoIIIE-like protein